MKANQAYLALDLWTAFGFDSQEFAPYVQQHGLAETWARLLDVARQPRTTCAAQVDAGDWCVLAEGHIGPHCDAEDVGPPNDLRAALREAATS